MGLGIGTVGAVGPFKSMPPAVNNNASPPFQDPYPLSMPRVPSALMPMVALLYILKSLVQYVEISHGFHSHGTLALLTCMLPPAYMLMSRSACMLMSPCGAYIH
jgi:hypothetical protein